MPWHGDFGFIERRKGVEMFRFHAGRVAIDAGLPGGQIKRQLPELDIDTVHLSARRHACGGPGI